MVKFCAAEGREPHLRVGVACVFVISVAFADGTYDQYAPVLAVEAKGVQSSALGALGKCFHPF